MTRSYFDKVIKGTSDEIDVNQLGHPGVRCELVITAHFPNDQRTDEERQNDKTSRVFNVKALITKTSEGSDHIRGDFGPDDGASYIHLTEDADEFEFSSKDESFTVSKNSDNQFSFVKYTCTATSASEAKLKFFATINPTLDFLSYAINVPLHVSRISIFDEENHVQYIDYRSPNKPAVLSPRKISFANKFRPVFALYREAKNSNSDFYKFLCYYKILEGTLGKFRYIVITDAKERGATPNLKAPIVPDHGDINPGLREHINKYIGRSMKEFYDKFLTDIFRDSVAHFMKNDGFVLNVSDQNFVEQYADLAFVAELCVREAVEDCRRIDASE